MRPLPRFAALALTALAACQSYDFRHLTPQPIQIIKNDRTIGASPGIPYIMIVQDLSGSMCEPISMGVPLGSDGYCAADKQNQSKMGLTATNMASVLKSEIKEADAFYLGLTAFPNQINPSGNNSCQAPSASLFPIGQATTTLPEIIDWYGGTVGKVGGGTPTAATLTQAAKDPYLTADMSNAQKYVILITDGLPNCNDFNPCVLQPDQHKWSDDAGHGCESETFEQSLASHLGDPPGATPPPECACSNGACSDVTNGATCCVLDPATFSPSDTGYAYEVQEASEQCLDSANVLAITRQLFSQGVHTYVVGMGYDFSSAPGGLLDQLAQAGSGLPDAGYFQASDEMALKADLQSIFSTVVISCSYQLDSPVADPHLIQVDLDGTDEVLDDPNGFSYDNGDGGAGSISLNGSACLLLKDGKPHQLNITAVGSGM